MTAIRNASERKVCQLGVVTGLLMFLAFGTAPLYFKNQSSKFLHGLADAGFGELSADWTVQTITPFPFFSTLVRYLATGPGIETVYLLAAAFWCVYATGLLLVAAAELRNTPGRARSLLITAAALIVGHSFALTTLSVAMTNRSLVHLLTSGVAGQSIMSLGFQPAFFGACLLLALGLFSNGRPLAAALAGGASWLAHPAYVLPGLVVVSVGCLDLVRRKQKSKALQVALLAAVCCLPLLLSQFGEPARASAAERAEALAIIVHDRIPHHSQVSVWVTRGAGFAVLLIASAVVLGRGGMARKVLCVLLAIGVTGTVLQAASASDLVAYAAPWRVSTVAVPLATTVLMARASRYLVARNTRIALAVVAVLALCVPAGVVAGIVATSQRFANPLDATAVPLHRWVRQTLRPGSLFLVPPYDEALESFRLQTGAPILANWKTHPHTDPKAILEWRKRVGLAQAVYGGDAPCVALDRVRGVAPITHVVLPQGTALNCLAREQRVHTDNHYEVYRLR